MAGLVPAIHAFLLASTPRTWMPGTSVRRRASHFCPGTTTPESRKREWANSGRQRGLGLLGDGLERCRLVDGEIRQHLAVDRDARLGKAVDKDAVGHAERAHRGIE